MISYKPLVETLKKKKKSIYDLQVELQNPRLRQTLNTGRYITLETLDHICGYLNCKVSDVVIFEPGKQIKKDIPKKEYVEVNWTKLRLRCEELRTSFKKMSVRMDKSAGYLSSMASKPHISKSTADMIAGHFNYQLADILYSE